VHFDARPLRFERGDERALGARDALQAHERGGEEGDGEEGGEGEAREAPARRESGRLGR